MAPTYPEETDYQLVQAINAGKLDAAVALFEEHAIFISPRDGSQMKGQDAIRHALEALLATQVKIESQVVQGVQGNDVAMVATDWTITGTGPDGEPYTLSGRGVDCYRRQEDGRWLVAIKNPAVAAA
jgi:uncharacterized protein (TIGR02246 family)